MSRARSVVQHLCGPTAAAKNDIELSALDAFSRSCEAFRAGRSYSTSHPGNASATSDESSSSTNHDFTATSFSFSSFNITEATFRATTDAKSAALPCSSLEFSRTRSRLWTTGSSVAVVTAACNSTVPFTWTILSMTTTTTTTTVTASAVSPSLTAFTATKTWSSTPTTTVANCPVQKPDHHKLAIGLGIGLGVGVPVVIFVNWRILRRFRKRHNCDCQCEHCRSCQSARKRESRRMTME